MKNITLVALLLALSINLNAQGIQIRPVVGAGSVTSAFPGVATGKAEGGYLLTGLIAQDNRAIFNLRLQEVFMSTRVIDRHPSFEGLPTRFHEAEINIDGLSWLPIPNRNPVLFRIPVGVGYRLAYAPQNPVSISYRNARLINPVTSLWSDEVFIASDYRRHKLWFTAGAELGVWVGAWLVSAEAKWQWVARQRFTAPINQGFIPEKMPTNRYIGFSVSRNFQLFSWRASGQPSCPSF